MADVRETKLPGVGVRHEFTTENGDDIGVLVHHDGRREILVYDSDDPDKCSSLVSLTAADTRTVSELLGASRVTEAVAAVQQEIEGLAIEWIELTPQSPASGSDDRRRHVPHEDRIVDRRRDPRGSIDPGTRPRVPPRSRATSSSPSAPSRASPRCAS